MTRQAKSLVTEKGVLSTPNPQFGKRLHSEIAAKVVDFYHSPDVNRQMPGLKDYVSVKVLCNQSEFAFALLRGVPMKKTVLLFT